MIDNYLLVKHFIAIIKLLKVDVFVEVIIESTYLFVGAGCLLVKCFNSRGETPERAKALTFVDSKGSSSIDKRIGENRRFIWPG